MKQLMTIALLFATLTASAQDVTSEYVGGMLETKVVEQYDGVDAQELYMRALEVLSDWSGTQSQSRVNIDVQDKEQGLVVYKGQLFVGYHKFNVLAGWNVLADFSLKIRLKDGKAQLAMTVPSTTFRWSNEQSPAKETVMMSELVPEFKHKGSYKIKKAATTFVPQIPGLCERTVKELAARMHKNREDF